MNFKQHPLSAAFPAMHADEYQVLLDSIGEIGVQNPITLLDGMVIDGWHRYTAANEAGMDCPSVELGDVDPKDFVMAQNKARRHITAAQLAMATTAVYQWHSAHRPINSALSADLHKSTAQLANIAGVGARSIEQAKAVQSKGAPEVLEAVRRGEVGLPKAAAIAKLPMNEQAAALHKPAPKAFKPAPVVEPEQEAPPDYTELDAAHDQINALQSDLVVARMGDIPDDQKQQAADRIAEQDAQIKTLEATLRAVTNSRDSYMEENSQMKRQMAMQRKEIEKLKNNK